MNIEVEGELERAFSSWSMEPSESWPPPRPSFEDLQPLHGGLQSVQCRRAALADTAARFGAIAAAEFRRSPRMRREKPSNTLKRRLCHCNLLLLAPSEVKRFTASGTVPAPKDWCKKLYVSKGPTSWQKGGAEDSAQ